MSISDDQKALDFARQYADVKALELQGMVRDMCPSYHEARQHRDGRQPWCPHCGRTDRGVRIKHVDQ